MDNYFYNEIRDNKIPNSNFNRLNSVQPILRHNEELDDEENLNDSIHFNFNNHTYYLSSHDAKQNVINMQRFMKITLLLDFLSSIFYGIRFEPIFYIFPLLGVGLYGIWRFRPNLVICYQVYIMINICLRIYIAFLEEIIWRKVFYWTFIPMEFYTLYKSWYYVWEIRILNSYDRKVLRKGWTGERPLFMMTDF